MAIATGLARKLRGHIGSAALRKPVPQHARAFSSKSKVPAAALATSLQDAPVPADVQPLFEPLKIGRYELQHRIVYAPLTRCRAFNTIPQPLAAEYYAQRATAGGLLISEATCISPQGHGYPNTPGIYTKEHIEAWKPIVSAVHAKGGLFFLQIWHCGRASHPDYQPNGADPISSSNVGVSEASGLEVYTPKGGPFKYPPPRALEEAEIAEVVQQYAQAAKNAIEAGFDGVEIHGANGYLIDQFTRDGVNKRTDKYGGPIENRIRFATEVTQAVIDAVGADRTGIRLSPCQSFLDAFDSTPYATHTLLVERLNPLDLAYLHMVEPREQGADAPVEGSKDSLVPFRTVSKAPFIAAGGYTRSSGQEAVRSGHTDAVAYGRIFLANPDLVQRFILDAPLNKYDRNTFYGGGLEGYTDYPTLEQS